MDTSSRLLDPPTAFGGATPLVVTADELLVADVLRLAAAAGVVPEIVRDAPAALRAWRSAGLVLVGSDLATELAACSPPRRARVHLLAHAPAADELFRAALAVGAESVAALPASETWLVEMLTDVDDGGQAPGTTIGVIGGCGGAGATVFAAALAQTASRHESTLVVDADPLGSGVDRVLGLERLDGIRWDAMLQTTGRLSARSLREALPRTGALSVLSWPADRVGTLQPFAMREVLSAGRRGFEVLVLDLPRHPDPLTEEVITRCDHLVVVTTLTLPAVAAAARLVQRLPDRAPRRHLVTRGGSTGVAPEEVSRLLKVPLLAAMPDQRGLDEAINLGAGPTRSRRGALARATRAGLAVLRAAS